VPVGTLTGTVPPPNVIVLEFDPLLHFGDAEVRLETVALAVVFAVSLLVAGLIARATPAGEPADRPGIRTHLRADDLLFIAIGALPGAVVGGRLGYVLIHLDYYSAHQGAVIDPAQGGLELTLGVVGGIITALYVLRLLNAPVGRWAHVAVFPLLLALGTAKLVGVLGADGQGAPTDAAWGTLYVGDGPWGSLAPDIASHPSQAYEGIATLLVLQVMTILVARSVFRRPDGAALLVGLALWAGVRAIVATTWRDAPVLGPLLAEQLIALSVAAGCALLLVRRRRRGPRIATSTDAARVTAAAAAIEMTGEAEAS
jgi:phosphatidylglycerol:prolipoprotein diacylglycerol transferase